jgi:hypothetical protein
MEKIRIRDGKKSDPESGIGKNIPDPQHCFTYCIGTVPLLLGFAGKDPDHDPDPKKLVGSEIGLPKQKCRVKGTLARS